MEKYTVELLDDGTMDTVVSVNGRVYRFVDVDRSRPGWDEDIRSQAIGSYEEDDTYDADAGIQGAK